jgi:hypothetical protein
VGQAQTNFGLAGMGLKKGLPMRHRSANLAEIYGKTGTSGTKNPSEGISLQRSGVRANIPFSRYGRSKKTKAKAVRTYVENAQPRVN